MFSIITRAFVSAVTHFPALAHAAGSVAKVIKPVVQLGKNLLHNNIGLLGLDRVISYFFG